MKNFWLDKKAATDLSNLMILPATITVNPPYQGNYTVTVCTTPSVSIPFAEDQITQFVIGCDVSGFEPYKLIEDTNG